MQRLLYLVGTESDLESLNMGLQKYAHVAVFFVLGILFFYVSRVSLPRSPNLSVLSYAGTVVACSACAVIEEVGKIWILGRHLQWDETMLDIAGVICGTKIGGARAVDPMISKYKVEESEINAKI